MDISTAWPKSDIHTWTYPWISISTASLPISAWKCTKSVWRPAARSRWGSLQHSPDPLAEFKGQGKGREKTGKEWGKGGGSGEKEEGHEGVGRKEKEDEGQGGGKPCSSTFPFHFQRLWSHPTCWRYINKSIIIIIIKGKESGYRAPTVIFKSRRLYSTVYMQLTQRELGGSWRWFCTLHFRRDSTVEYMVCHLRTL